MGGLVAHAKRIGSPEAHRRWVHERLLEAAAKMYERYGATGATTRRIAAEAQVNEVTLFRHFGTKEALLEAATQAAMRRVVPPRGARGEPGRLPTVPVHPHEELTRWCTLQIAHLREVRGLLQRAVADQMEGAATCNPHGAFLAMHDALRLYAANLRQHGFGVQESAVPLAIATLVSVLATDGLGRTELERMLPAESEAATSYAQLFLSMVGSAASPMAMQDEDMPPDAAWWSSDATPAPLAFEWSEPEPSRR